MAYFVYPQNQRHSSYQGIDSIFEYTNADGAWVRTNCGQAAAATLLTFYGKLAPSIDQAWQVMRDLERQYPPDNLGGFFGTSRRRVTRMCRAFGLCLNAIEGEEAVRKHLANRNPAVVMLGVSAGRFLNFELPGGHWMVAYGYDDESIFLTNGGRMSWPEFLHGWDSFVPRLISMHLRGLVVNPVYRIHKP
jgi:hypothetical protein